MEKTVGHKTTAGYRQIAYSIMEEIESGKKKPGEAIDSINSLAKKWNTTRSTAKRALDLLTDEGNVVALHGKGYFVIDNGKLDPPESPNLKVFISYAHEDDRRSGGGITKLRRAIEEEYALKTGNEVSIFQDTKNIEWGMDWREEIDKAIGATLFFMPILTPTYLKRPHCLAELHAAINTFESLGYEKGIYPIEFVDCSKAIENLRDDALANTLAGTQRITSWKELQYEAPDSSSYRKEIAVIVETLMKREEELGQANEDRIIQNTNIIGDEDESDPLAEIAEINETLSNLTATTLNIGNDIEAIASEFDATEIMRDSTPKSIIHITANLAHRLEEPCKSIESHCDDYSADIRSVSKGIDAIVEITAALDEMGLGNNALQQLTSLHESICQLLEETEMAFSQIESMRTSLKAFAKISRSMRNPCRRIDTALDKVVASKIFFHEWERKLRPWNEEMHANG